METKNNIYLVTKDGQVIPEMTFKTEDEAYLALGRDIIKMAAEISTKVLIEVGRDAANGPNRYRVQRAEISW